MINLRIRDARESDAEFFVDLWNALDTETEFMLFEPGERRAALDDEKSKLANAVYSENVHIVVLEDSGKNCLAGFCAGRRSSNLRNKHSLHTVIGIRQAYTGKKWGHRLLAKLELWAKSVNVSRLELSVMVNNPRAIALYRNFGFGIEGTKKNAIFLRSGFVDEHIMAKLL